MTQIKFNPLTLCLCGLFAALSAVLSWIAIPVAPVPVVLTHVSIFMAAALLGPWYGTVSQAVYVMLGAAGAPVFSGFQGGLGHIAGPTGGYIFGYMIAALIVGLLIECFGIRIWVLALIFAAGCLSVYVIGVPWLMAQQKLTLFQALNAGCFPYLPGDAAKSALCAVLVNRLHPSLRGRIKR